LLLSITSSVILIVAVHDLNGGAALGVVVDLRVDVCSIYKKCQICGVKEVR